MLKVPPIVATLGTLSIFRGVDYVIAGPDQVPLASLPEGFTHIARTDFLGIPVFVLLTIGVVVVGSVLLRSTRFASGQTRAFAKSSRRNSRPSTKR